MGSRDGVTTITSLQILNAVDKADAEYPDIRKMYDRLCEFTHPNWAGVLGAYSAINTERLVTSFARDIGKPPLQFGLAPFLGSLTVFIDHYNEMADTLDLLNKRFDQQS